MTTAILEDSVGLKRRPENPNPVMSEAWFWAGWEPHRHYQRRGGSRGTFYFGNGPWVEEWGQRLFSDEAIELAAGMGATILVTQFYKGIGRKMESSLWPALRDFTERCHRRGIKVWGYVQGSSIYPEFMSLERPDMDDWVSVDYHGKQQCWGASYFRLTPCLTSEAYRDYMVSVVRDGMSLVGLDDLHVDNSYYKHCWCERCQKKFRDYLTARGDLEQTTGIPDARHIKAPPLPKNSDHVQDPLRIHWIEFGVQVRLDFYRHLRAALKEENPDALLSGNSAFPRTDLACELRLALNPATEGEIFDYCCAENGNQPRLEKGVFIGQSDACLFAEAGGYRVWSTAWRQGAFGNSPPPDPAAVWAVAAEEFSHGAAILGNNWALRSAGEGGKFLCEQISAQSRSFEEAMRFFKELHREESLEGRQSWTDVGILVDAHSFSIAAPADPPALRQLTQYLFHAKIPFRFVFPGREFPASIQTLVVWSASCLSRKTLSELVGFAEKPGKQVLVSETSGVFDEWHVPHDFGFLRQWRQQPGIFVVRAGALKAAAAGASASHFHDAAVTLDAGHRTALDGFFLGEDFQPRMRFTLPESVLVHTERSQGGELLVHLREQSGSGQAVRGAKVWISDELNRAENARFHSPGRPQRVVSSSGEEFSLPDFLHYGLLVVPEKP